MSDTQKGRDMSTEPALMSLTAVAQAIAQKRLSSREVTQSCLDRIARWQPRLNAFMAIEADAALAAADAADAALAKGGGRGALHGVPLAHKDMYYDAGKVVTCGSKIRRDFVATTTSTALQRLKDAGTVRLGSLQMAEFAYGPTGHNAHFGAVHNPWALRSHHRRFVVGIGRRGRRPADLRGAGLGHRRLDPDARAFLRRHRIEDHRWAASAAPARCRCRSRSTPSGRWRAPPEDCALLLGLMAGADPDDPTAVDGPVPDYMAATQRADQRPDHRRAHRLLCRRSRSRSGAHPR